MGMVRASVFRNPPIQHSDLMTHVNLHIEISNIQLGNGRPYDKYNVNTHRHTH